MLATFLFVVYFSVFCLAFCAGDSDRKNGREYNDDWSIGLSISSVNSGVETNIKTEGDEEVHTVATETKTFGEYVMEKYGDVDVLDETTNEVNNGEENTCEKSEAINHETQDELGKTVSEISNTQTTEVNPLRRNISQMRKLAIEWNKQHPDNRIKGAARGTWNYLFTELDARQAI